MRPVLDLADFRLTSSSRVLDTSFDSNPLPAASSFVGPAYPAKTPFSELLRQKWNQAIGTAVSGVQTTDWAALGNATVGAVQDAASRIGSATNSAIHQTAAVSEAESLAAPIGILGAVDDLKAAAEKIDDKAHLALLRAKTHVDAPAKPSAPVTEAPKRLV